eukprot:jgi/Orpsp1_1/1181623/evm.model.c7180000077969.1
MNYNNYIENENDSKENDYDDDIFNNSKDNFIDYDRENNDFNGRDLKEEIYDNGYDNDSDYNGDNDYSNDNYEDNDNDYYNDSDYDNDNDNDDYSNSDYDDNNNYNNEEINFLNEIESKKDSKIIQYLSNSNNIYLDETLISLFEDRISYSLKYLFIDNESFDFYIKLIQAYVCIKNENFYNIKPVLQLIKKLMKLIEKDYSEQSLSLLNRNNISSKLYEILLYSYKFAFICSFSNKNSVYSKILSKEVLNNLDDIFIPGGEPNDDLFIKTGDEIQKYIKSRRNGIVYLCNCKYWYIVNESRFSMETGNCENCGEKIGGLLYKYK